MYVDAYVDVVLLMVLPDQCLGKNMSKTTVDMFPHVRTSLGCPLNQSTLFTALMVTNICDIPLGIGGANGGHIRRDFGAQAL